MTESDFPIGQQVRLPGHFGEPVVLETVHRIGSGWECRLRLPAGANRSTGEHAAPNVKRLGAILCAKRHIFASGHRICWI